MGVTRDGAAVSRQGAWGPPQATGGPAMGGFDGREMMDRSKPQYGPPTGVGGGIGRLNQDPRGQDQQAYGGSDQFEPQQGAGAAVMERSPPRPGSAFGRGGGVTAMDLAAIRPGGGGSYYGDWSSIGRTPDLSRQTMYSRERGGEEERKPPVTTPPVTTPPVTTPPIETPPEDPRIPDDGKEPELPGDEDDREKPQEPSPIDDPPVYNPPRGPGGGDYDDFDETHGKTPADDDDYNPGDSPGTGQNPNDPPIEAPEGTHDPSRRTWTTGRTDAPGIKLPPGIDRINTGPVQTHFEPMDGRKWGDDWTWTDISDIDQHTGQPTGGQNPYVYQPGSQKPDYREGPDPFADRRDPTELPGYTSDLAAIRGERYTDPGTERIAGPDPYRTAPGSERIAGPEVTDRPAEGPDPYADSGGIRGELEQFAREGLDAPSRYDNELVRQGMELADRELSQQGQRARRDLDEFASSRGIVGSNIELEEHRRLGEGLEAQRAQRLFDLNREQAMTAAQDRTSAGQLAGQAQQLHQQESQFGRGLHEEQAGRHQQESQFGRGLGEQQAGRYQQESQFARGQEQQESQFGRELAEHQAQREQQESQFARDHGLDSAKFTESQRQFDSTMEETRDARAQQESQFAREPRARRGPVPRIAAPVQPPDGGADHVASATGEPVHARARPRPYPLVGSVRA